MEYSSLVLPKPTAPSYIRNSVFIPNFSALNSMQFTQSPPSSPSPSPFIPSPQILFILLPRNSRSESMNQCKSLTIIGASKRSGEEFRTKRKKRRQENKRTTAPRAALAMAWSAQSATENRKSKRSLKTAPYVASVLSSLLGRFVHIKTD